MDQENIIAVLNKAWGWTGFIAHRIEKINDFGNIIYQSESGEYYRIIPEELHCEQIANSTSAYTELIKDPEFRTDWRMDNLVQIAKQELGGLSDKQKHCLKIPAVIGGKYDISNIGKISFKELISFSGNMAFQIKDLDDGQEIELKIIK